MLLANIPVEWRDSPTKRNTTALECGVTYVVLMESIGPVGGRWSVVGGLWSVVGGRCRTRPLARRCLAQRSCEFGLCLLSNDCFLRSYFYQYLFHCDYHFTRQLHYLIFSNYIMRKLLTDKIISK